MKKKTSFSQPRKNFTVRVVALVSLEQARKLAELSNRTGQSAGAVLRQLITEAK